MPSVTHVISGLGRGGAEKQLYLLLKYGDRAAFAPVVVSLSAGGVWAPEIRRLGIPVIEFPRRHRFELARLRALCGALRRAAPSIVHTWLLPDTVYGVIAARAARVPVVIASRRNEWYPRSVVYALSRALWPWTDAVVCNAERARRAAPGGLAGRHVVVRNGVELPAAAGTRADARRRLRIDGDRLLVGTVGRLTGQKNQALFVDLAARVARRRPDVDFVLIGGGPLESELRSRVAARGLATRVHLTGERGDVAVLLPGLDVFVLTSDREGLSNALMEAMAAGLPCVASDVGGNGELVVDGESGFLYPRRDAASLEERVGRLLEAPALRGDMGRRGRARVEAEFSAPRMAADMETLYRRLLGARPRPVDHAWLPASGGSRP